MVHDVIAGIKEIAVAPAAALGLLSFQMLRYQFWGFGLFVFALYAKNLVEGGGDKADTLALLCRASAVWSVAPWSGDRAEAEGPRSADPYAARLDDLLGGGTVLFGCWCRSSGSPGCCSCGFFSFFLGKISADTITQQSMPDDFRGRAFALFDIAYNVGLHRARDHPVDHLGRGKRSRRG